MKKQRCEDGRPCHRCINSLRACIDRTYPAERMSDDSDEMVSNDAPQLTQDNMFCLVAPHAKAAIDSPFLLPRCVVRGRSERNDSGEMEKWRN
eukprot:766649-Hanusia_phi.AAC.1